MNSLKTARWHWRVRPTAEQLLFSPNPLRLIKRMVLQKANDFLLFSRPSLRPVGRLSEDCEYFAYGLSSSGSDWVTLSFMRADDLSQLPDTLERVKFSCLAWTHDAKGVFYNCYPRQDGKTDGEEETPRTQAPLRPFNANVYWINIHSRRITALCFG